VVGGLINLRGQIVTAIDLRKRLAMSERQHSDQPMNVVVRTAEGAVSLLVDEIGDVVEVADSTFEEAPDTLKGVGRELIRGVYKLKERLLLLLDTERAIDIAGATRPV
jgi:purine-binding chemotaxis protein CheW